MGVLLFHPISLRQAGKARDASSGYNLEKLKFRKSKMIQIKIYNKMKKEIRVLLSIPACAVTPKAGPELGVGDSQKVVVLCELWIVMLCIRRPPAGGGVEL